MINVSIPIEPTDSQRRIQRDAPRTWVMTSGFANRMASAPNVTGGWKNH